MRKISVIVATYNRCHQLKNFLNSLVNQEFDKSFDYEVIIVDNNSTDDTKSVVTGFMNQFNGKLKYLLERRQAQAYALNKGIKEACGEIIAINDDDVILCKDWLKNINKYFKLYPDIAAIGGKILPKFECKVPPWLTLNQPYLLKGALNYYDYGNKAFEIDKDKQFLGANVAIRSDVFKKHGLLSEKITKHGNRILIFPDTEFYHRIKNRGEKIMYAPDVFVEHVFDESRINKRYFKRWYYYTGISSVFVYPPKKAKKIFRIPLWLFKRTCFHFLKSLVFWFKNQKAKSFFHEVQFYFDLGQMRGYLKDGF